MAPIPPPHASGKETEMSGMRGLVAGVLLGLLLVQQAASKTNPGQRRPAAPLLGGAQRGARALRPPQLAAFSRGSCPRYAGELLEEFKAAMLARPQHTNWTKALASWTCPPQTGSCDDICGDGVSRAAPASCCLCTAAAQTTEAVEGGHHRRVPLAAAAAVVGVGACRLPRPAAELRQVWGEPTS